MRITEVTARDIRFPTSRTLAASDAVHTSPDYSTAYVVLKSDDPGGLEGHGLSFTCGRGTELLVAGVRTLAPLVTGRSLDGIVEDFRGFWRLLASDGQVCWVGPGTCWRNPGANRCGSSWQTCPPKNWSA